MTSIYKTFAKVKGKWEVVPQGATGQPFCFVQGKDSIDRIHTVYGIPKDLLKAEFEVKVGAPKVDEAEAEKVKAAPKHKKKK